MAGKHLNKLNKIMLLSFLFSFINYFILFVEEYMPKAVVLISIVMIAYILILTLNENKEFDEFKPKFRIALLIITLVIVVLGSTYASDSIEYLAGSMGLLTAIFLGLNGIFCLSTNAKLTTKINESNKKDVVKNVLDGEVTSPVNKKKYLPVGYTSKKGYVIFFAITFIVTIICIFMVSVLSQSGNMLLTFGAVIILFIFYFFGIIIRNKLINKPIIDFENDFDYKKLEEYYTKAINDDKVHPETVNYSKLILANYIGLFSNEERKQKMLEVYEPVTPGFKMFYMIVKELDNIDDKEYYLKTLENLKEDESLQLKVFQKQITTYIHKMRCIYGEENVEDFDKAFPVVRKTKMAIILNQLDKAKYYF